MHKSYCIFIAFLMFLISACSTQPSPEAIRTSWSEEDLSRFVATMGQDVGTLLGQASAGLTVLNAIPQNSPAKNFSILSSVSSLQSPEMLLEDLGTLSFLEPLAGVIDNKLPRGVYSFNTATGQWILKNDSSDLVLNFPIQNPDFTTSNAKVSFDWDANAPTVKVMSAGGSTEVPTDMAILAKIDNILVGKVAIKASWYQSDCAYRTLEPSGFGITGELYGSSSEKLSFSLNLATQSTGKNTTVDFDGSVKVQVGDDYGALSFETSLNTTISRDSNCYLSDIKLNKGDLAAHLETYIQGEAHSLGIKFGFDNPVLNDATGEFSLDILKGVITADGQTVVGFSGRLDDSNGNGIPGENIVIDFDDGSSTSLEALLSSL